MAERNPVGFSGDGSQEARPKIILSTAIQQDRAVAYLPRADPGRCGHHRVRRRLNQSRCRPQPVLPRYVVALHQRPDDIDEEFKDTRISNGLFSGGTPSTGTTRETWRYQAMKRSRPASACPRHEGPAKREVGGSPRRKLHGSAGAARAPDPDRRPHDCSNPRGVPILKLARRPVHADRWAGGRWVSQEKFSRWPGHTANPGRGPDHAFVYSLGWTSTRWACRCQ